MTETINFYEVTPEDDDNSTEIVGGAQISDTDDTFRYLVSWNYPTTTVDGFEAVFEREDNSTAVIGGDDATPGEFPWQVEVTYN